MTSLIAIAINLAGMVLIYAWMTLVLARLRWTGRGLGHGLVAIVIAGLFWIVPAMFFVRGEVNPSDAYAIWFANWVVSMVSIVVFSHAVRSMPAALHDSARLDGRGWFDSYRQIVFFFVRRDLALVALVTLLATSVHCLTPLPASGTGFFPPPWFALPGQLLTGTRPLEAIGIVVAGSLVMSFPAAAIFFFTTRRVTTA